MSERSEDYGMILQTNTVSPMTIREKVALSGAAAGGAFYLGGIAALLAGFSSGGLILLGIIPAGLTCMLADYTGSK